MGKGLPSINDTSPCDQEDSEITVVISKAPQVVVFKVSQFVCLRVTFNT